MNEETLVQLLETNDFIPLVAMLGGMFIAVVAIVAAAVTKVSVSRGRERTKRELAAYVAEGTIDPDKAVAMINAGRPRWECCSTGSDVDGKRA